MENEKVLTIPEANAFLIENLARMLTEFCQEENINTRQLPLDILVRKVNRGGEVSSTHMYLNANKDKYGQLMHVSAIIGNPFGSK